MVSSVNSHTIATRIGWHMWEIDLRFATGLPPGWRSKSSAPLQAVVKENLLHSFAHTPRAEYVVELPDGLPPPSGSEAGSYLRLIDFCITQLQV